MAIEAKIFKLITPKSQADPNYEQFEFLLAWYGRDGSYYNYLFTDWEGRNNMRASILNIKDKTNLSNVITSEERQITLVAEDLSLNDFTVLQSILVSKKIVRVYKDGTVDRVGIDSNSARFKQTDGRYNLEFDIYLHEKALAK